MRRESSDMGKGNNPMQTIIAFLFVLLDGKPDSRLILFLCLRFKSIQDALFCRIITNCYAIGQFPSHPHKSFKSR